MRMSVEALYNDMLVSMGSDSALKVLTSFGSYKNLLPKVCNGALETTSLYPQFVIRGTNIISLANSHPFHN